MANNNLTSNAIEETKTLSNKLAISGYFDLFFQTKPVHIITQIQRFMKGIILNLTL